MTYSNIEKINLKELGMIGRFGSIYWWKFGKIDDEGKKWQYGLHLQANWRLFDSETKQIIAASQDAFTISEYRSEKWDVSDESGSLLDEKNIKINLQLMKEDVYVSSVEINDLLEINIIFSNGWELQTFTCSPNLELWRFIEYETNLPHMIARDNKLNFE